MPNIYALITEINNTQQSPNLTPEEQTFLKTLLDGKEKHWRPLNEFALQPTQKEIKKMIQALEEEINNTYFFNFKKISTHFTYKSCLQACLTTFNKMLERMQYLTKLEKSQPKEYKKFTTQMSQLYIETEKNYHGTVMLPVIQGLDSRLGNSNGECLGYTNQWALQLLQNKNPFGIHISQPPPFKVVSFHSRLILQHPHFNHLGVLNNDISQYQKLKKPAEIKSNTQQMITFFLDISSMCDKLLKCIQKQPYSVYKISCLGGNVGFAGHAMGFCKKNNLYHFFDSNSMWVRFDTFENFQKWLVFYFQIKGYHKLFHEYSINSYELNQTEEDKPLNVVAKIILSPLILLVSSITILYMGIGRPLIYCGFHIKKLGQAIINLFDKTTEYATVPQPANISFSQDDFNYLAKSNKIKFIDSTHMVAEQLDIDQTKLQSAKSELLRNDNKVMPFQGEESRSGHREQVAVRRII
ncbi:MAG TPA: hypothetical protein VHM20_04695 [Gammaproteobacteria bacterium]|jgi:hypothetical protein|nr:hypothetical protein [Gammaproteobacteria bacterium]